MKPFDRANISAKIEAWTADADSIGGLDFRPRGIALGVKGVRTLPHLPNYRLYDWAGSPCDTLGISVATETPRRAGCDFRILPNPARGEALLEWTDCPEMSGTVFDVTGRLVQHFSAGAGAVQLGAGG